MLYAVVLPEGGREVGWLVCFYYNWWDGLGWGQTGARSGIELGEMVL